MAQNNIEKVLIAEDDADMLSFITDALQKYDNKFKVVTASNGKEAIDLFKKHQISLLITDVRMPKIDGLSLLAYVTENHPSTPCFVMTAHKMPQVLKGLKDDTLVLHYIPKPFNAGIIGQEIVRVLENKKPLGTVEGISIVNFLSMIEMERKTCQFEAKAHNKDKAIFYFEDGNLYDVKCGRLRGERAAIKSITMDKAVFRFLPFPKHQFAKRKKMNLKGLIKKAIKDNAEIKQSKKNK